MSLGLTFSFGELFHPYWLMNLSVGVSGHSEAQKRQKEHSHDPNTTSCHWRETEL